MKISDLLKMSLSSLWKRKVRTVLTVLGVVIGTISIVVMMSLGIGMKSSMLDEMESHGNMKVVSVTYDTWSHQGEDNESMYLDDDAAALFSGLEHVEMAAPILESSCLLKSGMYVAYGSLKGYTTEGMEKLGLKLDRGELPTDEEELSFLYGNTVITDFYNPKNYDYVYYSTGETIDLDYMTDPVFVIFDMDKYYSAGMTDENGNPIKSPKKYIIPASGVMAGGPDEYLNDNSYSIICNMKPLIAKLKKEFKGQVIPGQPTKSTGKPYKEIYYSRIDVYVDEMENVTEVQKQIQEMGYDATSEVEWIESSLQSLNITQGVLGGIGAVSLLVAAIGIANTMMMSIYERTKEIGIMKVIGCSIKDIQMLFLLEAGYIGLIGGTVGIMLSYIISVVVNNIVNKQQELGYTDISRIPPWLAAVALVFAVIVGMLSGFFPSLRAMKLSPLTAIKNE